MYIIATYNTHNDTYIFNLTWSPREKIGALPEYFKVVGFKDYGEHGAQFILDLITASLRPWRISDDTFMPHHRVKVAALLLNDVWGPESILVEEYRYQVEERDDMTRPEQLRLWMDYWNGDHYGDVNPDERIMWRSGRPTFSFEIEEHHQ